VVDPARTRVSYAQYLAAAEASDVRLEFVAGDIVAMSGGTIAHGRLIAQLSGLLREALTGKPCLVMPADVRVRIRAADRATYPDAFVVCGTIETDADDADAVVNPTVVVEVLSETSSAADRGDKFAAYRRLRALREYVLVSQRERRVDVYTREGRRWILEEFRTGETVRLEALGVTLAVDAIYVDALGAIVE
jgi:Uma2 family endonuclease